jgi:hypothetical protein
LGEPVNMNQNRMIKVVSVIFIFVILTLSPKIYGQSDKFENGIVEIIKAFNSKDSDLINNYINPDFGLIVLFRRGVYDEFEKTNNIDFGNPIPEYLPYFNFNLDLKIIFQNLPKYDCDSEKWNKTGLYCDSTLRDNLLSKTAINSRQDREDSITTATIEIFKEIEAKSHRIVLVDSEGGELIFYITQINGLWYLTILDRVSSDCSA